MKSITEKIALTKMELIKKVEFLVNNDNSTYLEALVEIGKKEELDEDDLAGLVKGPLRLKLEVESINKNRLKDSKKYQTTSLF